MGASSHTALSKCGPELNVLLLSGYGFPIIGKPFLEFDLKRVMSKTTELC